MANSLLDIQPHKVSRDLRGYSVFFFGDPKSGKTTIASKFPGALVLAFEKGYNAIPGIMAKPINSHSDFRKTLVELRDPEVQEKFQTIVIDTADICYNYVEKYICNRETDANHSYEQISDIPFGKGFKMAQQEFDECIRKILQMNYGLVLISHAQDKTFKDENNNEYNQIIPTIENKGRLVCERTCDIIGYSRVVDTEDGSKTKLFLRGTPRFVAGSRFKYIEPVIDFNYESLVNAIADAVDKEASENNNQYVTQDKVNLHTNEDEQKEYDFNGMMEEFSSLVGQILNKNPNNNATIVNIVDKYLGKGKKVSECNEQQAPQLDLILFELRKIA